MENSALELVRKIKECNTTNRLWDVVRYDILITREQFAEVVNYHRNTISKWETKIQSIPVLYKQYWFGRPRSVLLDRYQVVVLLAIVSIRAEYRGLGFISKLRQLTPMLDRFQVLEAIEVLRNV